MESATTIARMNDPNKHSAFNALQLLSPHHQQQMGFSAPQQQQSFDSALYNARYSGTNGTGPSPSSTRPSSTQAHPTHLANLSLALQSGDQFSSMYSSLASPTNQRPYSSTNTLNLTNINNLSNGNTGANQWSYGKESQQSKPVNGFDPMTSFQSMQTFFNQHQLQQSHSQQVDTGNQHFDFAALLKQTQQQQQQQQQSHPQSQSQSFNGLNGLGSLNHFDLMNFQQSLALNGASMMKSMAAMNNSHPSFHSLNGLTGLPSLANLNGMTLNSLQGLSAGLANFNTNAHTHSGNNISANHSGNPLASLQQLSALNSALAGVQNLGGLSVNGLAIDNPTYQCTHPTCGQMLKSRFSLKRHMKKHTGEKPHLCPFPTCNRKFSETTALKRHARIHTGEKPYRCGFPDCTKTFADATNVKRHEMTHTGEKPYRCLCQNCGRCFSRRSSLRTHMISLHNIRPDSPMIAASLRRDSALIPDLGRASLPEALTAGPQGMKREREESSSAGSTSGSEAMSLQSISSVSSPSETQSVHAHVLHHPQAAMLELL